MCQRYSGRCSIRGVSKQTHVTRPQHIDTCHSLKSVPPRLLVEDQATLLRSHLAKLMVSKLNIPCSRTRSPFTSHELAPRYTITR